MDDVLTPEDVANAKKNLTALKRNTSGFLRAQARKTAKAKAKEEETSATASKNLLHAAAEGKLEDCRRLITDQRRCALARCPPRAVPGTRKRRMKTRHGRLFFNDCGA